MQRTNRWLLLISLVLGCTGACDESSDAPTGSTAGSGAEQGESLCTTACETATQAGCPDEDLSTCLNECMGLWDASRCTDEARALIRCAAELSLGDLECDPVSGEAAPKTGLCESEEDTVEACIAQ